MISLARFHNYFAELFGMMPEIIARAPGRVNLIGEHTDYNQGYVLPMAIDREIWVGMSPRDDGALCGFSLDLEEPGQVRIGEWARTHSWIDYPAGVARCLAEQGFAIGGANLLVAGDVPIGAGLSSSAALLVASATCFCRLARAELAPLELIRLCRQAENSHVGVASGIMDPYISCAGKAGHALWIDCRTLGAASVPIPAGLSILVGDTGVRRKLVGSGYNDRQAECEEGVTVLRQMFGGAASLRDVTLDQLKSAVHGMKPAVGRRCLHVISENARVLAAVEALRSGHAARFGQLMDESHRSLREDYEVSCPELDHMVEITRRQPGVLGSRMTGAGFGGCTVSLVQADLSAAAADQVGETYARTFSGGACYVCRPAAGVSILR